MAVVLEKKILLFKREVGQSSPIVAVLYSVKKNNYPDLIFN